MLLSGENQSDCKIYKIYVTPLQNNKIPLTGISKYFIIRSLLYFIICLN